MLEEDLWIGVSILFKKRNCIWVFAIVSWIKSTWEILNYKIQLVATSDLPKSIF